MNKSSLLIVALLVCALIATSFAAKSSSKRTIASKAIPASDAKAYSRAKAHSRSRTQTVDICTTNHAASSATCLENCEGSEDIFCADVCLEHANEAYLLCTLN